MMKSNGIRILETLPIPSSTSLFETNQNNAHRIMLQRKVGNIMELIPLKLEEPPTFAAKNADGSVPHPNVKLFKKYTKSQLKITI